MDTIGKNISIFSKCEKTVPLTECQFFSWNEKTVPDGMSVASKKYKIIV